MDSKRLFLKQALGPVHFHRFSFILSGASVYLFYILFYSILFWLAISPVSIMLSSTISTIKSELLAVFVSAPIKITTYTHLQCIYNFLIFHRKIGTMVFHKCPKDFKPSRWLQNIFCNNSCYGMLILKKEKN